LRLFGQHDEETFDGLFDVNVKGALFLIQALVPVLASQRCDRERVTPASLVSRDACGNQYSS